jgi:MoxR-like ATPase
LFGPAGTGKNVLCQQLAEELGLDFYYSSTVTQEFKVTGYGDAQGRFVETEFYKAFTKGVLFMLDELDASCPEALVCLNAALANKYIDFPTIGRVEAHPDFRVIAAGNTACRGADALYEARQPIDAATMNRFMFIRVDYDERIERKLCKGDIEFLEFVHDLRNASKIAEYPFVLSYRNISDAKAFMDDFSITEVMEMCITKGIPSDDLRVLYGGLSNKYNRYAMNFYELCK